MNRKKCFIITAYISDGFDEALKEKLNLSKGDYILCADGGYKYAVDCGVLPDLVIGDFDSFSEEIPREIERVSYPSEKDDTDTMLCVKYAAQKGFDDICIVGGIGGRLDHTLSNIQSMSWALDFWKGENLCGKRITMGDKQNHVMLVEDETIELSGSPCEKFSLVSYTEKCIGVFAKNVKWELSDAVLSFSFPLGISNEFIGTTCTVGVEKGKLLVIRSVDSI